MTAVSLGLTGVKRGFSAEREVLGRTRSAFGRNTARHRQSFIVLGMFSFASGPGPGPVRSRPSGRSRGAPADREEQRNEECERSPARPAAGGGGGGDPGAGTGAGGLRHPFRRCGQGTENEYGM